MYMHGGTAQRPNPNSCWGPLKGKALVQIKKPLLYQQFLKSYKTGAYINVIWHGHKRSSVILFSFNISMCALAIQTRTVMLEMLVARPLLETWIIINISMDI